MQEKTHILKKTGVALFTFAVGAMVLAGCATEEKEILKPAKENQVEKEVQKEVPKEKENEKTEKSTSKNENQEQVDISEQDVLRVATDFKKEQDFIDKLAEAGYTDSIYEKNVAIAGDGVNETKADLFIYKIKDKYLVFYSKDGEIMTQPAQFAPVFIGEIEKNDLLKK